MIDGSHVAILDNNRWRCC